MLGSMLRLVVLAGCAFVLQLAAPARAQEPASDRELQHGNAAWYTITGIESCVLVTTLILAGAAAADGEPSGGESDAGLSFASCLLLGIGLGYASEASHWEPGPAFAIHGGIWDTLALAMIGALIDARDNPDDVFGFGPFSLLFGMAGAGLGALIGLTQFDTELEVALWYLAPIAGALIGLVTWLATDTWQDAGATDAQDTRRAWTAALAGFGGTLLTAHGITFAIR